MSTVEATTKSGQAFIERMSSVVVRGLPVDIGEVVRAVNAIEAEARLPDRGLRKASRQAVDLLQRVIDVSESQHPGGWGPDVTTVELLRNARAALRPALSPRPGTPKENR